MDSGELKQRTKRYALWVIKLVDALPKNAIGRVIAYQLMKSGTSTAANYRAACRARSRAEFIAKIGTVIDEADESAFWLELIIESELIKKDRVEPLLQETNEIISIMVATSKSTKKREHQKS